ncbi:ChbG/HpnK family deacetylase [soil metagenome]
MSAMVEAVKQAGVRIGVCIDDFGLHSGIDDAAMELIALGRVSAVGCMVQGPSWQADAAALRAQAGDRADIGLHLNLTEPIGMTAQEKAGASLRGLIARAYLGRLAHSEVHDAVRRQLDAFEDAMGSPPEFVDGHQHVHQLPIVREVLIEELCLRYAGVRPWLRVSSASAHTLVVDGRFGKARVIDALGASALRRLAHARSICTNTSLIGVYDFADDANAYLVRLETWLRGAADGDLLMCHPSSRVEAGDSIASARVVEFGVLAGVEFGAMLRALGVQVARLSQLLLTPASPPRNSSTARTAP